MNYELNIVPLQSEIILWHYGTENIFQTEEKEMADEDAARAWRSY